MILNIKKMRNSTNAVDQQVSWPDKWKYCDYGGDCSYNLYFIQMLRGNNDGNFWISLTTLMRIIWR